MAKATMTIGKMELKINGQTIIESEGTTIDLLPKPIRLTASQLKALQILNEQNRYVRLSNFNGSETYHFKTRWNAHRASVKRLVGLGYAEYRPLHESSDFSVARITDAGRSALESAGG